MHKHPLVQTAVTQVHFSTTKLLLTCLLACLSSLGQASEDSDYQLLLRQFQEPLKSELQQVAQFVAKQHPGKIINIQNYSDNPDKYYRVKLINDSGYLKTYYIDQAINKVKP